ncbi:hypothetical protein [Brevundimonas aurifodinae]|uniref:Uncharacterized protein n=2 Tax=Brevundimonas TaxID=41275 RepID=A0ABV1NRI1_9CAUL|nr:MAG: hypothetical protein B7Z42_15775 [Brevundimonas sp. 12-68-7]OYX33688.1 MAG: hypothetical protein B7Z01_08005 [Brevundimonas subvibrioides]
MLIALGLAAALTASDPDLIATAPAGTGSVIVGAEAPVADAVPDPQSTAITPHNLTTQQQIDRWLSARTAETEPFADDGSPVDDRRMHGYVSGSIGSNDFSAVEVGVSLPVGENGRIDLTYQQVRNGHGLYGYGYGYGYGGYGYGYGGGLYGDRRGQGYDDLDGPPLNAPNSFFGPGWSHAGRDRSREPRTSIGLSYQSGSDRKRADDRRR